MSATDDPFTQVHDALWAMVVADQTLCGDSTATPPTYGLIRPGNRIKSDTDKGPVDRTLREADVPRLYLKPKNGVMRPVQDSHKGTILHLLDWVLVTGDARPKELLYPIQWQLYRIMYAARTTLGALTWNSKVFCYDAETTTFNVTWGAEELNQSFPQGWTGLYTMRVLFDFDRTDLTPV